MTYGTNKLALYTLGEKTISIVIESEELAKTFRAMIDYIWYLKSRSKD